MSKVDRARQGRRFSLLGTSSLVASALFAGLGGVALTAFTPAVALASCTPTAAGATSGSAANAKGVQTCGAGDAGVYYNATGNLNIVFTGEPVGPNGVGAGNATQPYNVILGINTTTETAGNIAGGIGLTSNGGSVEVDTGSAALGSFAGASVTGVVGISTVTAGPGTTKINAYNDVSGSVVGISAEAGAGTVTINAETNTGGGINVSGGSGGIVVQGGGAVTITAPGNTSSAGTAFAAIGAYGAAGNTTIVAGNTTGAANAIVVGGSGNISITSSGTANGGTSVGIVAATSHGTIDITTKDVGNGILAGGGTGLVTITTNGNVTGANGVTVDNGALGSGSGSANVTLNGNVSNTAHGFVATGVTIDESGGAGNITLTQAANTAISSNQGAGVVLTTKTGDITLNLASVSSTVADAIDVTSASGNISGKVSGVVVGDAAVNINTAGSGTINMTYSGNVSGSDGAIEQGTQNGDNTAHLQGNASSPSVFNGGAGTSPAISVTASGRGNVTVTATTYTSISSTNSTGVVATSVSGNVTVSLAGSVTAGNVGVVASSGSGSLVTVLVPGNGTISSVNDAIDASNGGAGATVALPGNIGLPVSDNIGVLVQTGNGSQLSSSSGNGIVATESATSGAAGILIVQDGNIGSATTHVGASGIVATITNGANAGNIYVVSSGNIESTGGFGIDAATAGSGSVTILAESGATIDPHPGIGIKSSDPGGNELIVTDDNIVANMGIDAEHVAGAGANATIDMFGGSIFTYSGDGIFGNTTGDATTNVYLTDGLITAYGGDGIHALSTGTGLISVIVADSTINAETPGYDAIDAEGHGSVLVTVDPSTIAGPTSGSGYGIFAVSHPGLSSATVSVSVEGDSLKNTTVSGNTAIYAENDNNGGVTVTIGPDVTLISYSGDGIQVVNKGSGATSVSADGNITTGNIGIAVTTMSGNASVGYNNTGNASATMNFGGNVGVEAIASGPGNVSATVQLGNGVGQTTIHSTDNSVISTGVLASASGTGAATITSAGNVTVDPTEFAQEATSPLGKASITTGLNDSNSVNDPLGVAPEHIGLYAVTGQVAGTASAVITIAGNNTISVTGLAADMSGSAGVAAVDDAGGDLVVNTTKGATGLSITVGGDDSAGIVASTIGGDGTSSVGVYGKNLGSAGNVTVNTGAGQITVGGTDTTGVNTSDNFANAYGIFTATNGGNISVDNQAGITVSNGAGEGTIGIASVNTGSGSATISLTNAGNIAAGSAGIAAVQDAFFTGAVTVNNTGAITMGGGPVATYTVGGLTESVSIGILADSGLGNVSITNSGTISQAGYGIVGLGDDPVTIANSGNISAVDGGIYAFGSGTVLVNNTAATINVSAGDGIDAYGFSGTVTVNQGNGSITAAGTAINAEAYDSATVTVSNKGNLTGTAGDGISAISGSGSVSVSSTGPSVTGGIDAIYAQASGSNTVTVGTALAPITSVLGSAITTDAAIRTQAGSGTTTIVTGNTASMAADNNATYGIVANSTSGAINITNAAQIGSSGLGVNGVGIFAGESATGTTGVITIVNSGDIYAKTNGNFTVTVGSFGLTGTAGILAINNGNGDIDITNSGNIDPPAIGIAAVTFGNVTVDNTGSIAASSVGITALSVGGGAVTVNNTGTGTLINVSAGNGIDAESFGGSGPIAVTQGSGTITASGTGINVIGSGVETITSTGTVTGTTGAGISAITSGNGTVLVAVDAPDGGEGFAAITGGDYGITATSAATGNTTVEVGMNSFSGTVTVSATGNTSVNGNLGPVGILAVGGTGGGNIGAVTSVTVENNGLVIAANGRGIVTDSANNAEIDNYGAVVGLGDATHPVIDVTAPLGATTTIYNDGFIGDDNTWAWFNDGTEAEFVAGVSNLAIRGTTGSVSIDNEYYLEGRVDFSGLTGNSSVSITNDYEWDTNGTSVLAPTGNDTITNTQYGLIATSIDQVATTIVFGNMTNTFANAGEFDVGVDDLTTGTAAAPAVTTLSGNLSFVNTGVVVLGAPYFGAGTSDRNVGAILDAPGAAWSGTGTLSLSANLWSTSQGATDCTSLVLTAGDCLIVGSTAGNTAIQVLDTNAHAYGAFNPTGIAIVVGSSAADTFHLASSSDYYDGAAADAWMFGGHTGVLDKPGLFFYDLAYNSAQSTEVLIGVPKATAFEFASFAGAMDGVWYTTTQTWFDRTTDQRDSLQGRADGSQPAVWLKAVGDWTSRTQSASFSDYGNTYNYNTSYNQSTAGLLGGVDLLHVVQKDQAWTFGIETGWVQSDLRFGGGSPDTLSATATDLGGYVTYLSGGLFVDGVVNANFLRLNDDLPQLGVPPVTSDTNGTSWGGQVEAGYEMPLGATAFWEPVGSLAYVDTTFGALPVPGGIDQLGADTSFRGSLGARLGMTQDFQYYKVKVAVTARVWDEFENNPTGTLIVAGGSDFASSDNLKGLFGEVSGQANLFTTSSGLSAFLTGGIKFKTDYNEGTVTIGARYQW